MNYIELGEFRLWRDFAVRSCGFAFEHLSALGSPCATREADAQSPRDLVALEAAIAQDRAALNDRIKRLLSERPMLADAMAWQNRMGYQIGVLGLTTSPGTKFDSKYRQREELFAKYLQRYCSKNDTIGYFGPLFWGTVVDGTSTIRIGTVESPQSIHSVYLEHWAVQAFVRALCDSPEARLQFKPRAKPIAYVIKRREGLGDLRQDFEALLPRLDGTTYAADLVRPLESSNANEHSAQYAALLAAEDLGLLEWIPEVPTGRRETHLKHARDILDRLPVPMRAFAQQQLDLLEGHLHALREVANMRSPISGPLAELDAFFEKVTGLASSRRGGKTYAARTLAYPECRRDADVALSTEVFRRIELQLRSIALSCRWLTHAVAVPLRAALEERIRLRWPSGACAVPLVDLWSDLCELVPHGGGKYPQGAAQAREEFKTRWIQVLQPLVEGSSLTPEELWARASESFSAPYPGWPLAVHCSPDLMIAAPTLQHLDDGLGKIIVGEVHFKNTLEPNAFFDACPDKERFVRDVEADVGVERFLRSLGPDDEHSRRISHMHPASRDVHIDIHASGLERLGVRHVRLNALEVRRNGDSYSIGLVGEPQHWDLMHFLDYYVSKGGVEFFPRRPHIPRLEVGGVVFQRESWTFDRNDLSFVDQRSEAARFGGWRDFVAMHRLPRFVFAKLPTERKPFLVDACSVALVNVLCRATRQAPWLRLTEMLPIPMDQWNRGTDGQHYACELRMVIADSQRWRPPRDQEASKLWS